MEYRLLPTELLVGAVCLAIVLSLTLIRKLVKEVARASKESERDASELFSYLKKTGTMFDEYYARQQSKQTESALNL
jgi:predicted outer membrane protein